MQIRSTSPSTAGVRNALNCITPNQLALILIGWMLVLPSLNGEEVGEARGVLERTLGRNMAACIDLRLTAPGDSYRYLAANGRLQVEGGSIVAICRRVYDYLRAHNLGTVGWAGPRLKLPAAWPDAPETKGSSPFRVRHCYNAVTSGYTTPYWDWQRWEQELDWLTCTAST